VPAIELVSCIPARYERRRRHGAQTTKIALLIRRLTFRHSGGMNVARVNVDKPRVLVYRHIAIVERGTTNEAQVTVVIPVWGRYVSAELERAVQSVKAASVHPIRVVVVDNAHEHVIALPGSELLRSATRLTLGEARNLGLTVVDSPYVLFLDADDQLLPGSIDRLLAAAAHSSSSRGSPPAVVTAPLADPRTLGLYHWPSRWMQRTAHRPGAFRVLEAVRASFPVNGSLICTEVAAAGPGFDADPASAEDWVFGVSLAWRGRVVFAVEPAMTYAPTIGGQWSRHRAVASQRRHQACVRRRVRQEPSVPAWVKAALPLLWLAHHLDLLRLVASAKPASRAPTGTPATGAPRAAPTPPVPRPAP